MKKIILFSGLVLAGLQAAAQNVVIWGKVSNRESDSVLLAIPENNFNSKELRTYARLNEKNEFRLTVDLKQPVLADLENGDDAFTLFLQPGDNLEVKFSATDMVKSITFKGQGAAENNYMRDQEKKFAVNEDYQVLPDNIYFREDGFVKFIDSKKEDQIAFLDKYIKKGNLSESFKEFAKAQIEFTWANDRITFPDLREKIVFAEKRLVMTPEYYSFLKDMNMSNQAAFISPIYNDFALNYMNYLAGEARVTKANNEYYQTCFDLAKTKLTGPALNLLQARIIYESCKNGHIGFTERMLREFEKTNSNKAYSAIIRDVYEANKKFALGSVAPEFKITTISGDTVRLSDYKGKLVYLSFWETDCGLCLMDLPYAQELTKKLQGRDIVFLNIGMDKEEQVWKNMVTKKELEGVHAFGKHASDDLRKLYPLKEAPAYFLIAEDGTFLSTKPKRPSSHGAREEIAQAFGKAANVASALNKTE